MRLRGVNIDMIVPNAEIGEQFAPGVRYVGKHIRLKPVTQRGHDHIVVTQSLPHLVGRQRICGGTHVHIKRGAGARFNLIRQRSGQPKFHQCILPPTGTV